MPKASKEPKKKGARKAKGKAVPVKAGDYLKDLLALRSKDEPPDFGMLTDALHGEVSRRIPTGILALDKMLGGGYPEGRIIEVAAWEGVGKSTLLDQAAAQCQRMGGIAALIDSERARDIEYTTKLGVNVGECILAEADDLEDGFEQLDKIIAVQAKKRSELEKLKEDPPPVLVLWDSLGGTPARLEVQGTPDDTHVSPAARAISLNFRRIVGQLAENRITLVFANHFYQQIGGFGGSLKSFGGKGVRYYPSVRLWLSRTGALKVGDKVIGHTIKANLRKTKVGPPKPDEELGLIHTAGIDNSYTLFNWGLKGESSPGEPWIWTKGSHRYLRPPGHEPIHFQRGSLGLGEILSEHPDIYAQMAAAYMEAA
jgi:recombination protein RecA